MKIVKFQGGLGNQMFQYVLMLSLGEHFKEIIYADITMFKNYDWHEFEIEKVFNLQLPKSTTNDLQKVTYYHNNYLLRRLIKKILGRKSSEYVEKSTFLFDNKVYSNNNKQFFDGYWINSQYTDNVSDKLRRDFVFNNKLSEKNQLTTIEIRESESVSIHVRRGNYLQLDTYKGICELDYYQAAIDYILQKNEKVVFYVFSNDINWCKENLTPLFNGNHFCLVDWNLEQDNYIDMQLMSLCKHNIIAHSTFSWWAAWLNANPDKIVVAPKKWINDVVFTPNLSDWILF